MKKVLFPLLSLLGITLAVYALNKKPKPAPKQQSTTSSIKDSVKNDSKKKDKPDPITPF